MFTQLKSNRSGITSFCSFFRNLPGEICLANLQQQNKCTHVVIIRKTSIRKYRRTSFKSFELKSEPKLGKISVTT